MARLQPGVRRRNGSQDIADFRGRPLDDILDHKNGVFGYPLNITCVMNEWVTGGEVTAVSCMPWSFESGMYGPYWYIGDLSNGICVHSSLFGTEEELEGIYDVVFDHVSYQMMVLWKPLTKRYEGYLSAHGAHSTELGYQLGDVV
jgi:hypothetical protein